MPKNLRQRNIVDLLASSQMLSVAELSKILDSSMMTIRRDLKYLEEKGIIKKQYGGVVLVKGDMVQASFEERINQSRIEKQEIGKVAAGLIKKGSIVFFDTGTTTLEVVNSIPKDLEFTAITTGLMAAVALCSKPKANIISISGEIHHSTYSATNTIAIELIKRFNADIAFISTKAISFPEGTFEPLLQLIEVKLAMISVSKEVVLLADHTKFDLKSLCLAIPMDKIHTVITDMKTPDTILKKIEECKIRVIRA